VNYKKHGKHSQNAKTVYSTWSILYRAAGGSGGEVAQVPGSDELSKMLSADRDAATVGAADANGSAAEAGGVPVGCSRERQTACSTLLNATFTYAANVTSQRRVVPDFDDERLETICR